MSGIMFGVDGYAIDQRSVRELNPAFLPTDRRAAETPTDQSVIPDGIEPSLSWFHPGVFAVGPRDRWLFLLSLIDVSDRGRGRTDRITRLSTWPLCQNCVLGRHGGSGGRTRRAEVMSLC